MKKFPKYSACNFFCFELLPTLLFVVYAFKLNEDKQRVKNMPYLGSLLGKLYSAGT